VILALVTANSILDMLFTMTTTESKDVIFLVQTREGESALARSQARYIKLKMVAHKISYHRDLNLETACNT